MRWSLKLATVAGIGIYLHWTFLLLIGFILVAYLYSEPDWFAALRGVGFVLALFGCVVLHELGQARTARRFVIGTRDITLLPIGGVARLERMPEDPLQEFLVALAGPAVNVVIAALLGFGLVLGGGASRLFEVQFLGGSFVAQLMGANIVLVLFNLLPAFPMDGGRVLRAVLATQMSYTRATHIAAAVGQVMAIGFGLLGLYPGMQMLLFVALFVFLGAQAEARATEMRSIFQGAVVRDAMATHFRTLPAETTLEEVARELLAGHQHDFPVMRNHQLLGMLPRQVVIEALRAGGHEGPIEPLVNRECPRLGELEPLDRAVRRMREADCNSAPVLRGEMLIGLLTNENVGEWTMIHAALQAPRRAPQPIPAEVARETSG